MAKIITSQNYKYDGDDYCITVHYYGEDQKHVEAKWKRHRDGKMGELGYGLGQCDATIYLAERLIQKQRLEEKAAVQH